jgi:hypothetical protein
MENVDVFSCQVEYITVIWYIFGQLVLWSFGILVAIWYLFSPFGILCQEKSGNTGVVVTT